MCATTKLGGSLIYNVLVNNIGVFRSLREWIVHRFKWEINASPVVGSKVKQFRYRPEQAQRVDRGIDPPFRDLGAKSGQHHAAAALPLGKTRYPLYRRLGGPQGRSGRLRKVFDSAFDN
jgi:hypothetical protein